MLRSTTKRKMTKYKCPNCNRIDSIKWGAKGLGLVDMTINFKCPKCGSGIYLYIVFPKDKKKKPKVNIEYQERDYIG